MQVSSTFRGDICLRETMTWCEVKVQIRISAMYVLYMKDPPCSTHKHTTHIVTGVIKSLDSLWHHNVPNTQAGKSEAARFLICMEAAQGTHGFVPYMDSTHGLMHACSQVRLVQTRPPKQPGHPNQVAAETLLLE